MYLKKQGLVDVAELMPEIKGFVKNALVYLNSHFKQSMGREDIGLSAVYPYAFYGIKGIDAVYETKDKPGNLGILYESMIPNNVKKDFGQFYTKEDSVIELMVNSANVLDGKILEPSCGSGLFLVKILEKIVLELKEKDVCPEDILEYICDNVHANDIDNNAVAITEINMLASLLPLIIDAKRNNPGFVMRPLKISNLDFVRKNILKKEYSLIIGNPPFVTMYGKRSRNMTEEKRAYFNTFDFVQNKKGNNKFNISMFFIENGLKLLKPNGHLNFILDITFLETAFTDVRKYVVENYYINSLITGLQAFEGVASGQLIIDIINEKPFNDNVKLTDYITKKTSMVNQLKWNSAENKYKFNAPLNEMQKAINSKMVIYDCLEKFFPYKSLRTCCALTGKTEEFIVDPREEKKCVTFPYIEGSKGLKGKFFRPTPNRFIKYDYELQLKLSNEFKEELETLGVKNKKRVTLGDKEAYLAPKIFIRQSASEVMATYCKEPYAANNSIYILTTKENTEESIGMLKYTCGLLNSDLITFYCRINRIIRAGRGKTPQIKISDLKNIRLHVDSKYYRSVIEVVEKLLINPKQEDLIQRLNSLVYKIYNIDDDEIKFITEYLMA